MALTNLGLTNNNTDGTITIYSPQGNVIEETGTTETSIFASPGTTYSIDPLPIWYAPAETDAYFTNILNDPNFATVASGIAVFKMYEILASWSDTTLTSFFSYLAANNIKLGIEALPLTAGPGQPGYGIESFGAPGDLVDLVGRIKTLGGNLSYVAWDEPLTYGSESSGIYTVSQTATLVAQATAEVTAIFPNAQVGDIEGVGGPGNDTTTLAAFFTDYAQANGGKGFDFLQADVATWSGGWQTQLADTITLAHGSGMTVGVIIDGMNAAPTDDAWATQAVANAQLILSTPSLRPDYVIVQSWQTDPSEASDPATAGTLASVEADVADGRAAALAVPAVAQYGTDGLLQSIAWDGGWTASQNGTDLTFSSATGATILELPWSDVENFAFNPSAATVSLTYLKPTSLQGQWQTITSLVSVTTAGFDFTTEATPALAAMVASTAIDTTPGEPALSLGLAATSATGFTGSGITDQASPTVAGVAAPNAVVAIQLDGVSIGTATATSSGNWSYGFAARLPDGAHAVQASETVDGFSQQLLTVVSVDTATPAATTLLLGPGSDTGYPGDDVTDVTQPVFCGVADPGAQIDLVINGTAVPGLKTDISGNWSFGGEAALGLGTYAVSATAVNPAGTTSATAIMQLTIDTPAQETANIAPDPLFDTEWYSLTYPQAASSGVSAYTQFMSVGWKEGYDPNPYFDTNYYLTQYPDVAATGMNPLTHFELYGWEEGRDINPNENTNAYEQANPAIPAGEDPLVYYIEGQQNTATADSVGTIATAGFYTADIHTVSDVSVTTIAGGEREYVFGQDNDAATTIAQASNVVLLGSGADTLTSLGTDTILGGSGPDTVSASANVTMQSNGPLRFINGGGSSLVVLEGAGTVTGGTGSVSVLGGTGSMSVVGGAAGNNFMQAGQGNATLIGGGDQNFFVGGLAGSTTSVTTAGESVVFGSAGTVDVTSGASTVFGIGGTGTMLLNNGAGSYVYFGGSGSTTINEGAGGDVVIPGSGAITVNQASGGEQLYQGTGTITLNATEPSTERAADAIGLFEGQAGGTLYFNGFQSGFDAIYAEGYGADAETAALNSQTTVSGGNYTLLTFSDGTKLYLTGLDGHATASIFAG